MKTPLRTTGVLIALYSTVLGCGLALAANSKVIDCGTECKSYLQSTFEAKGAVEAGSAYSEVKCETVRLEKSVPFRVGPRYAGTFGGGRGLINGRITLRCVPYSGRDPVLLVRSFTIDADLHVCERSSLKGKVDRDACPNLISN